MAEVEPAGAPFASLSAGSCTASGTASVGESLLSSAIGTASVGESLLSPAVVDSLNSKQSLCRPIQSWESYCY